MPEIGPTLREARMRARLDVSQLEARTKIRAKYLRALENEEWSSLPGPTYIKSFLRTYADALGLDGKLLVHEYKARHEGLADSEVRPIAPPGARRQRRERRSRGAARDVTVALVIVAIFAALFGLSRTGGGGGQTASTPTTPSPARGHAKGAAPAPARPRHHHRDTVRLELLARGQVYVCLQAGTRRLVNQAILLPGERRGPFRARRFTMTFGNYAILMRVDGRTLTVPPSPGPVGYVLTSRGRQALPPSQQPTCGA